MTRWGVRVANLGQNMVKNVLESICDAMPDCVGRR